MNFQEYAEQNGFDEYDPDRLGETRDENIDVWGFATIPNWAAVKQTLQMWPITVKRAGVELTRVGKKEVEARDGNRVRLHLLADLKHSNNSAVKVLFRIIGDTP